MTDPHKSTQWKEVLKDGEAEQFEEFGRRINRMQDLFAHRDDGMLRRGFHRKIHAGLSAEFRVLDDIPSYAKQGVFKEAKRFKAWVRFSNGFPGSRSDKLPGIRGFAVKLLDVEGARLPGGANDSKTQDFIALNQPYIPARDAHQFVVMSTATSINLLTASFKMVRGLGLTDTLRVILWGLRLVRPVHSLATETYWSNLPITLGPHAVKFKWQPRRAPDSGFSIFSSRHYLRHEFRQRLQQDDIGFDFEAQFFVNEEDTPVEKGAARWKESDAPFIKLAELVIPHRDLDSYQAKLEERYVDRLSFNPWHAIEEHRPIGNAQRSRAVIYEASSTYRGRLGEPSGVETFSDSPAE